MRATITGRAIADAATLARKVLTDRHRRAAIITAEPVEPHGLGAFLVAADGYRYYREAVGTAAGTVGGDGIRPTVNLDGAKAYRKVGEVTVTPDGDGYALAGGVAGRWPAMTPADRDGHPALGRTYPDVGTAVSRLEVIGAEAADVLAELQAVAVVAASGLDARAVLTAVALTAGEACATDTYRMRIAAVPAEGPDPIAASGNYCGLVPADVVRAMPGRVDLLRVEASAEAWTVEVRTVGTRTKPVRRITVGGYGIEGPYPNYRGLLPDPASLEDAGRFTVPAGMADALAPVRKLAPAMVTATADGLTVGAPDGSTAVAVGTAVAGPVEVAMNGGYLAGMVDYLAGGEVTVRDAMRPLVGTAGGRTELLMPMRVA